MANQQGGSVWACCWRHLHLREVPQQATVAQFTCAGRKVYCESKVNGGSDV